MFEFEKQKRQEGYSYIIGCDEVGRGALAGPIVAAAALYKIDGLLDIEEAWISQVRDSKRLSQSKRVDLDKKIRNSVVNFGIGKVSNKEIDKNNIHQANLSSIHQAVKEILKNLSRNSKIFLAIDGRFAVPELHIKQEAVVNGDDSVFAISAASIIAKVYRDNLMMKLDSKFPEYGFGEHKGYGTAKHIDAIKKYGVTDIHRKSFCRNIV